MGGKVMKKYGVETERKSTQEHKRIEKELIPIISNMFNTEVKIVEFYRNKETHGDCDLLILNHGNLGNISKKLEEKFGIVHANGNVYSFVYDKYQIDIIPQPTKNWETAKVFFDWDPSGNLMGKIAHKFGLKYGLQGLVYPFRTFSGRLSRDIVISKDNRKIFKFFDLDYDKYLKGFDNLEEIFEFIIDSKYFNPNNFLMENLNSIDRKRNKKRSTYKGFLDYINLKNFDKDSSFKFNKDKSSYHRMINEYFPESNFLEMLDELKKEDDRNKRISEKFNGNIVMEITGLKGKELGNFIHKFKQYIEDKRKVGFKEFVDSVEEGEIINQCKYFFKNKDYE